MSNPRPRPLALIILDGFGYRKEKDANAIAAANKPNWDSFCKKYPHSLIQGSGCSVGLPEGQMGNSEVGHLNMGAGRIVNQDLTRIDLAIENGDFFKNTLLVDSLTKARENKKAVHIMGLLSPGGVHSHEKHIHAVIQLAAQLKVDSLYIHAFLDGRDTPPQSAKESLNKLDTLCQQLHTGQIASLIGRYYAMDRDKRWERVEEAYRLIMFAEAKYKAATAEEGLNLAYARGESDEFVKATLICKDQIKPHPIEEDDVVIFMNYRADRAREITQSFIDPHFHGFVRNFGKKNPVMLESFLCLTEYDPRFTAPVIFPPESLDNILAEYVSHLGLRQLRIAETEKYAHVTFFFNGGVEVPYPGEDRILIPSPQVATYDLQPEMSAKELTDRLITEIKGTQYDLIICNFANPDMVGHTGNFAATVKAIETVDECLGKIIQALQEVGGEAIITADHGNAEQMYNYETKQPHTAHTCDPVPFIYIGRPAKIVKENGKLSDIAPTLLYLLGLHPPPQMTGENLLKLG